MSAVAREDMTGDESARGSPPGWASVRLSGLLSAMAERHPQRLALADQPNREEWSGRPRISWTYANTQRIVDRLATFLSRLRLPPGTPVGICMPNGSEACVALLSVERAGFVPCLLPAGWSDDLLAQAIETANIPAVICQGQVAEERPAEAFCRIAARYFGLRFICAFGPDVPDGAMDLDRAILDTRADLAAVGAPASAGLVTFQLRDGVPQPLFRPCSSLVSATVHYLVTEKVAPADRIISLVAPDDLRGLVTGLAACLVTGATLETHGLVDGRSLALALSSGEPVRLVAPAWLEATLAKAGLPETVVSTVLLHGAPVRFKARGDLKGAVTDVLCFGEAACLARARGPGGHLALSLQESTAAALASTELLMVRRDEDGAVHFAGPAAELYDFRRGAPLVPAQAEDWRFSGFRADLFAGIVIGVR